jgi:predicted HAD superfamily Cof-like phosphohydrolase
MVRRWRIAVGQPCADTPTLDVDAEQSWLAASLIKEEAREAYLAVRAGGLPDIAQELADLVWVAYGAAELHGIDLDRALGEVGDANMRKVAGGVRRRADGKILKPDGWVGPDMAAVIEQTRALGRQT